MNMYSSYKEIQENLNNCKIKNFDVKKTRIYEYLLKNNFDINIIYKSNFTSMCMKNNPTLIRIRNDKFLLCASNKEQSILIVPIKLITKLLHLSFILNHFMDTTSVHNLQTHLLLLISLSIWWTIFNILKMIQS
ncbi:hypothetical protein O7986_000493 [Mycoplasmopsis felis]